MSLYESVFIARQDVSAAQVDSLVEAFSTIITAQGGKVAKKEYWGLRNLTFRIKKNRKGHYVLLNLDAPAAAINEMERNMRINEDVIRYLTIRVEALEEGPSAMLQSRGREGRDRDGRDRDRDGRDGRFRDRDRDGRDRDRDGRDRDRDGSRGRGPRPEASGESAAPRPAEAPAPGENR